MTDLYVFPFQQPVNSAGVLECVMPSIPSLNASAHLDVRKVTQRPKKTKGKSNNLPP